MTDDYNYLNINDINNEEYNIHYKPLLQIINNNFSILSQKNKKQFDIFNMYLNFAGNNNFKEKISDYKTELDYYKQEYILCDIKLNNVQKENEKINSNINEKNLMIEKLKKELQKKNNELKIQNSKVKKFEEKCNQLLLENLKLKDLKQISLSQINFLEKENKKLQKDNLIKENNKIIIKNNNNNNLNNNNNNNHFNYIRNKSPDIINNKKNNFQKVNIYKKKTNNNNRPKNFFLKNNNNFLISDYDINNEYENLTYEQNLALEEKIGNVKIGLKKEKLNEFKTEKFKDNKNFDKQTNCVICMEEFKENDEIRELDCKHIFHKNCIDKWFTEHKKCPIDNKEI